MLSWSLIGDQNYERLSGYHIHEEDLYGLIRNGDERIVKTYSDNAVSYLAMLPHSVVKENELQGLYIWYYKSYYQISEGEIELLNKYTGGCIGLIDY